jgi:hypothetical protein
MIRRGMLLGAMLEAGYCAVLIQRGRLINPIRVWREEAIAPT